METSKFQIPHSQLSNYEKKKNNNSVKETNKKLLCRSHKTIRKLMLGYYVYKIDIILDSNWLLLQNKIIIRSILALLVGRWKCVEFKFFHLQLSNYKK